MVISNRFCNQHFWVILFIMNKNLEDKLQIKKNKHAVHITIRTQAAQQCRLITADQKSRSNITQKKAQRT